MHTSDSHDADTGVYGITWPKSYVAPHFDHLDLRIALVPLMMPLLSCDTDIGTNCITWPKKSCCTSFWLSWTKECNGVISIMQLILVLMVWDDQKIMLHLTSIVLWKAVVPLTTQYHVMLMPVPMALHDQKSHVAPHFYCLMKGM